MALGGSRELFGLNRLVEGRLDDGTVRAAALERAAKYRNMKIDRRTYADHYGPTTGDRIRLADTDLVIRIEHDATVYGDEAKFGGGKVIRDGMGQSPSATRAGGAPDLVITNVVIVDSTGIRKADVGIRDGRIAAIGKAGHPGIMDGVTPGLVIGASTEVMAGEGHILTAGAIDSHVHFISPNQIPDAFYSGITTLIGGGTGPATGTKATTCTPGGWNIRRMYEAAEAFPLNFGFLGKGNASGAEPLREQVRAGALGLKLHEDWGSTPAAIDQCLSVADEFDVQVAIHTDTINETGFVEDTIRAIAGRTIHTYHTEGAGGGHAPDIIRLCGEPNVLPSSTNPTMPFTRNTLDEHLDMLMVCHHLSPNVPEDVAFADSRIRPETIAAEDVLHDLGAFSMMSSDSQAMGRIGEVICRTWQTADKMKRQRGPLAGEAAGSDNLRVSALHREIHDQPGDHSWHLAPRRIHRGRQARRSRPVEAGILRRQAGDRHQGRVHRGRHDGRRERVNPDAAAGDCEADVRRVRRRAPGVQRSLRQPGGPRLGRACGACAGRRWPSGAVARCANRISCTTTRCRRSR